jgi:ring-1,2-phenylacetyl-CoA epoxidase subunit PaaD
MNQEQKILSLLEQVCDPEIPVLSVLDLGIIRAINFHNNQIEIIITPTYSGCPAMDVISMDIKLKLVAHGYKNIKITSILSPAWTTDWMTEAGKKKLAAYGIAPPQYSTQKNIVACPQCNSHNTKLLSQFGSTACKALYQCLDCKEPFDYFKCH